MKILLGILPYFVLIILGSGVGNPGETFAATMQSVEECTGKIGQSPKNINAQLDWVERRLACWAKSQIDDSSERTSKGSTAPQQYRALNSNKDFETGFHFYQRENYSKAKPFFEIAADAGHVESQRMLGVLYYHGQGVFKDYEIAFGWFRLAALEGDHEARKKLGYMYENGLGVLRDKQKANYWTRLSYTVDPLDSSTISAQSRRAGKSRLQSDSPTTRGLQRRKGLPSSPQDKRSVLGKKEPGRKEREFTIGYSLGYRYDQLGWNIAGLYTGCCPDIASELSWKDLHIFQLGFNATGRHNRFYYRGSFGYGTIFQGTMLDTDFGGDGRSDISSKINASSDRGNVLDTKIGIGFSWQSFIKGVEFIPMVGYSYSSQEVTMHEPASYHLGAGDLSGLESTYEARWRGPWVGFDLVARDVRGLDLRMIFEHHFVDFLGQGNWNLRNDLAHPKSFEQWNNGTAGEGILGRFDARYRVSTSWFATFMMQFQDWSAGKGVDRLFLASGGSTDTVLNEVYWKSFVAQFGASYIF